MNAYFKAKRLDNGEWVTGFFTKKKIGSLIVPVIEVYKEWDTGDYMDYYEIDGNTLESISVLPIDAYALEVFAIKDSNDSPIGKEAYIGYKIENGNFHFINVPYTERTKIKQDIINHWDWSVFVVGFSAGLLLMAITLFIKNI